MHCLSWVLRKDQGVAARRGAGLPGAADAHYLRGCLRTAARRFFSASSQRNHGRLKSIRHVRAFVLRGTITVRSCGRITIFSRNTTFLTDITFATIKGLGLPTKPRNFEGPFETRQCRRADRARLAASCFKGASRCLWVGRDQVRAPCCRPVASLVFLSGFLAPGLTPASLPSPPLCPSLGCPPPCRCLS